MDCPGAGPESITDYLRRFNHRVVKERVPVSGTVDLTHRCALDCIHCYLGPKEKVAAKAGAELDTARWLSLMDEMAEAGCLYLLISGGDPLVRRDFAQIYTRAKMRGMLVTVFTSGLTISDAILDLFKDLPPQQVELTLYGATDATYEGITGVRGSFDRCMAGIRALLGAGFRVGLKTVLMKQNRDEFHAIARIAADFGGGISFRCGPFPLPGRGPPPPGLPCGAGRRRGPGNGRPGKIPAMAELLCPGEGGPPAGLFVRLRGRGDQFLHRSIRESHPLPHDRCAGL